MPRGSFFELCVTLDAIYRDGEPVTTAERLSPPLHRTPAQVAGLLGAGLEAGLVERMGEGWRLSDRGVALASAVAAEREAVERRNLERFRPFTEYAPSRWWPD